MLFRIRCGRYYRQILKKSKVKDVYGLNIYFRNAHKDSLMFPITHMINLSLRFPCCSNNMELQFTNWGINQILKMTYEYILIS